MVAQVIKNKIEGIEYREKKVFFVLFSVCVLLIISYGFIMNNIMKNAVSKQNMEKEMASLSSKVNSMEFEYLNIKNSITLVYAQSKGFVQVASDKFAAIDSTKTNISLSINEN